MRLQETMPNAGLVHLDAQEIQMSILRCLLDESVTVAETDFEHDRGVATEQRIEVDAFGFGIDAKLGPELLQRALL